MAVAGMKDLASNPYCYVIKADKGGRIVLWKRDDYRKESLRQLSDSNVYKPLSKEEASAASSKLLTEKNALL